MSVLHLLSWEALGPLAGSSNLHSPSPQNGKYVLEFGGCVNKAGGG